MTQQQMLQYLPLLIILPVIYFRMRKLARARPLKWRNLWVQPAIFVGCTALVLATSLVAPKGPHLATEDVPWLVLAAVLGGLAGWQWGRTMAIEMHPENRTLMVKGGQGAIVLLLALIVVRMGLRTGLEMQAGAWHIKALLIADASIVFSALLFTVRSLEMYLRARKVMADHRP